MKNNHLARSLFCFLTWKFFVKFNVDTSSIYDLLLKLDLLFWLEHATKLKQLYYKAPKAIMKWPNYYKKM